MIKAAFFDIDGTILDHTGGESVFHESTRRALEALKRRGVKVFISTGRAPALLGEVGGMFPFDGFVTFNGQLVLEGDGTVLHRRAHEPEEVREIVRLSLEAGFPGLVLGERGSWPIADTPEARGHYKWRGIDMPEIFDPERLLELPVIQITLYATQQEAERALSGVRGAQPVMCAPRMVDVIPRGGGKETGLEAVIKHYGFSREETDAFGDGMNDLSMIKWAGTGVAMGNGEPEVKSAADYVTAPVWDDGVSKALVELGMLDSAELKEDKG